ncbi:MAG: Ig-like domain-containing protein [Pseudomonadota bacterium]
MPVLTTGVLTPRCRSAQFWVLADRLRTKRTLAQRFIAAARAAAFFLAMFFTLSVQAQLEVDDEDIDRAAIVGLSVVHRAAFAASFAPDPITALIAEGVAVASEVTLKFIRSPLTIPNDVSFRPRESLFDPETGSNEAECIHEFELPQAAFLSSDLFGFNLGTLLEGENVLFPVPQDWGDLGPPKTFHYNTEVMVSASNPFIERSLTPQTVRFPAGNHQIFWRADTVFDPIFDAALPAAILAATAYTKWRRGEFLLANPAGVDDLVKAYQKGQKAGKTLLQKAKLSVQFALDACESRPEVCLKRAYTFAGKPAADFVTDFEILTVNRERTQLFTVFDVHDPTLDILEPNLTIEALDFGGTFVDRVENQILASVEADDTCGRVVTLTNDLPILLPLGNTDVTWTATDPGPGLTRDRNSVTATQRITVQDTQAPIIVPPPSRVIEVDPSDFDGSDGLDSTGVNPAVVDLGIPRVVDLADPSPTISTDAPEFFPVDTRTEVTWSATDKGFPSPNTSTATQLITVKQLGTNTAPSVGNVSASTLTSQPVAIRLTGLDNDVLGGRVDPVAISIIDRPQNGEFVAPLLPYFIEDFRTSPLGPYGEDFFLSNNRSNWLFDNVCRIVTPEPPSTRILRDWVYVPRFVQVEDDGTHFMIDRYWRCGPSNASSEERISKWDRDGNYLGQMDYGGTTDNFVMDQDGFIYVLTRQGAGSSSTLSLQQFTPDFDSNSDFRRDFWRFDFASTGDDPVSQESLSYARVDSNAGLIYVNDRRRIFVYDVRSDLADPQRNSTNGMEDAYLGALRNSEEIFACTSFGSSWSGFAMEVESTGSLYVADTCGDRIHKFEPSFFDEQGEFQMGEYVGWMGRCDSSTNKACDEDRKTTKGYSCTDETCTTSSGTGRNNAGGSGPGQFSVPVYLAIDPNDILYVADSANDRIQRFAPDGTFAGQAESTGSGINRGDNPSFVLGNMGSPKAVSVNSSQFFVVDQEESFINVFETTPLQDITDDGATVSYVSEFDFHGGSDTFTYRASDGLDDSNLGTVTVNVSRNFRPPVVESLNVTTVEDTSVDITLIGDDPDGIIGEDFNGLDRISYSIVQPPEHGTLRGTAPDLTYEPDFDYFGEDQFTYVANDGRENSEEAVAAISITPVDDPLRLQDVAWPARVGRGFPTVLMASFTDDGGANGYSAELNWGDGTVERDGDFVDPDGEDGDEPPRLDGVKVMAPVGTSEGMAVADYIYTRTGSFSGRLCLSDGTTEVCDDNRVSVQELVNLAVSMTPDDPTTAADSQQLVLQITNTRPMGWSGRTAAGLGVAVSDIDGDYRVAGVTDPSGRGRCSLQAGALSCQPQDLAPGESLDLTLQIEPVGREAAGEVIAAVVATVTTSSDAISNEYNVSNTILFQSSTTDTDGDGMTDAFEERFGLNPNVNDAGADPDGDGLTNLEEFNANTDPTKADTDGDGLSDSVDPDPLDGLAASGGDLNGDGVTDARDVLVLQRALAGQGEASIDLNQDGRTDAADLMLLQQRVRAGG